MSSIDPRHSLFPERLRKLLDGLYLGAGWLAGVFLIMIFVIMLSLSAGRPLGIDVPAGDDFASWCMAATAFLALAHTFRSAELIRMGLLIDRFSGTLRRLIEIACTTIGAVAVIYFAWYAIDMTWVSWKFNDVSMGVIAVPLWIPQIGMSAGLAILAIAFVDELLHLLFGGVPRYQKPKVESPDEIVQRVMESGV
ncbi:TRAP-type C4-dicarboxylate transport system permease small subunit [Pseudorhizobium tarimense]|uniref:TRAP transporter small permease protein n=1 Tax=Pseudorhizobium tarimense TaxID=1079109 RepID=A0ABV2HC68_9HYPH|nr:TRAP transporter small permease [Pseudorhizobium tarimense]MCJ8521134.1 TRAP transporter small permease subunit [Pseudorhizobium tarimense]